MIKIDDEFARLIPPLTDDEYSRLEESIKKEGCRDALVLWGDILIDGHNRYKICEKHGIDYDTKQLEFDSREEVLIWIMQNQLSRRNLNDFQRVELVRKCEDAVRMQAEQRKLATLKQNQVTDREILPEREKEGKRATEELGNMAGVSRKTYEHAAVVLDKAPEPIIEATRRKELSINAAYGVTKLPEEHQAEIAERISLGESANTVIADVKRKPFVVNNTGNTEWFTPPNIIESARAVMSSIDLDPASCDKANETVKATTYYTKEDDGLAHEWYGNVFLNPPYAAGLVDRFARKLIEELPRIQQAIVLVNNATETEWFNSLVNYASAICFTKGRMRFVNQSGEGGASMQGQAIIYFGAFPEDFLREFKSQGWCASPLR